MQCEGVSQPTLSRPRGRRFGPERILLRTPFENLFITLALDALFITLLADWLGFVALQSFFLAGPAPYADR